jgi:Holliday junction DNA helicase RuvA
MIASLDGKLEVLSGDWAIINVSGIGFQVWMPTSTISTLGARGKDVHLHTHLILKEDGATLYGFASDEELQLFQTLISVSGLGPKLALSILSVMSVDQASMAIATGSAETLTMVPGIGKRMAERLIVELKDKMITRPITATTAQVAQENIDVLSALTSLGYSVNEASRAVSSLPPTPDLDLEEKVKLALQYFGNK